MSAAALALPVEEPAPQHRFWCAVEDGSGPCNCEGDEGSVLLVFGEEGIR